ALFTDKACDRVEIGASGRALSIERDRGPGVRRAQYRFRLRNDAEQRDRQDLLDVVDRQHLTLLDPLQRIAREQQMHVDGLEIVRGPPRFRGQNPEDTVAVANRGDFGVGDDDRAIGEIERSNCAVLDARWTVAHYVIEILLQFLKHPLDAVAFQRLFVAG